MHVSTQLGTSADEFTLEASTLKMIQGFQVWMWAVDTQGLPPRSQLCRLQWFFRLGFLIAEAKQGQYFLYLILSSFLAHTDSTARYTFITL